MNNNINTQSGERLSFYKLFKEKNYRIVIPIIQRDYAQGRESAKEVRNTFLDALYNYLDENKANRDLDFVYGSLEEENGITNFIPLDGQQRLTTLFLLHWYLCQISDDENKKIEFKTTLLKDEKSMFAYETRSSSSEFCDALMSSDIDFNNLLETDKDSNGNSKDNSLSKTIKNYSWFYLSWEYDPTIQSMLTMLDAINNKFSNKKEFFERLLDIKNSIVTFLFLNLQDFKLTDDLYIKMNSRGKVLTPFENFKAKFEQYLENLKTEKDFNLNFGDTNRNVSLKDYFSYNIDIKWANLFWNYRTLQNSSNTETDNTFDDELMNFIRVIFTNKYAENVDVSLKEKDDTLEYLLGTSTAKKNKDYSDIITFNKYDELQFFVSRKYDEQKDISQNKYEKVRSLSLEYILYLIDSFDSLVNGNENIKVYLPEDYKFYFDEDKVFENSLKHDFESNHQRLCFYAYVSYLITNIDDRSGINQWMRVIHNLSHPENTVIDSASEVAASVKAIKELLPQSNNILEELKNKQKITSFSNWQVTEEKIKAHLIAKNDVWKKKIEEIEKHRYFNGQIGFILEFAGIIEYYKDNNDCDWSDPKNEEYFESFKHYANKASKVFEDSYENRKNDEDFLFERAVLNKGDYLTDASQYRKNLLSTNLVKNNIKRDHSWKRLLRISDDEDWTKRRLLVKQVFDDKRFDENNLKSSLKSICNETTNTWRDYFIYCPELIEYCKQGFIRFENENNILLYGQSQSNHMHAEMYSYYMWKKYIEPNKDSFKPFNNIYYNEVKSIDDDPSIILGDFCHNRIYYEICVYYNNNDNLPNPYEIAVYKSKGENLQEKYGNDIKLILDKCALKWNDEYGGYFFTCEKSDELIKKIRELIEYINQIDL